MREVFARANYTDEGLLETLGPISLPSRTGRDLPHFLRLTRQGRPLDTLIRLFLFGVPMDADTAGQVLEPVPLDRWVRAGLLEVHNGLAAAPIKIMSFRGVLLVVDQPDRPDAAAQEEMVMGITACTVALADFTVRRPVSRTLDLGTGSGIQAFLAARHSRQVWATDRGPRCLNYALFNARLNNISNVEFLEGDTFEPVPNQRFDLVLFNTPFAITPSFRYLYRDSGLEGDQYCRRIVREAPQYLEEGGFCQITCDWIHPAGQDWKDRLARWFEGTGCEVWVMRTDTHDAGDYAQMWVRDTEYGSAQEAARLYEEWVSYYDRQGIEAISSGVIALRRSNRPSHWVRIEDAPEKMSGRVGDYVALGFELCDFLEAMRDDRKLLSECIRLSPELRLNQQCEWAEGTWHIVSAQLRLTRGLQFVGNVDRNAVRLISRLDGRRPLREALAELASAAGADLDKITPDCLTLVRQLIEHGFLLPASIQPPAA
jgi:SAM-dependent methyltransferase